MKNSTFSTNKKHGEIYEFLVSYKSTNIKKIYGIHRYLMILHQYKMFSLIKKVILCIMSAPLTWGYCILLKNQECKVRKVITDNDYMTFPYEIGIDRCIGSCNNKNNLYFKACLPDSIKNITVKFLDLISQKFIFKNISFHKSCKCGCLLDEKVCNNLQKFNKNKCRCQCLKIKKCKIGYSWNINNCGCETKKIARLIGIEKCDVETDEIKDVKCKILPKNKTLIKE